MLPRKILVINVARFGDTLLITPVLKALKEHWPMATLDVFAHKKTASIIENLPWVNQITPFSKKKAMWLKYFSPKQYDLALVYGNDDALVDYARRVSTLTVSFSNNPGNDAWCTVAPPKQLIPAQQERALLAQAVGVNITDWHLAYCVTEQERNFAHRFLTRHNLQNKRLVGFQLQSFPAKAYRDWPVSSFKAIAYRLLEHYPESHILLLGGVDGKSTADALASELGSRVTSFAGVLSMRQNAAVMSHLSLYLGVDTGPTHLAGALGIPMVAMYHAFHPGRYLAPQQHAELIVIEHPVKYADASREEPMSKIDVDTVWNAVNTLLSKCPEIKVSE
ncbi:heptosyltransferase-3 [Mangrovibacter plantisponsor]|uniref:Heptosyltransferase-3 n=2 Tax=Enterobacteriaceae TaxID=543 RepID=A0A317PTS4_9ENTR|nr:glycosyltransferase family 9 protein [Mangrovibacter plantisponsor]PWW05358.1 heptosyltransferase-3 [Mangrovibacter plantisponsor]